MDSTLIMSQVYSANLMTRAVSVFMYLMSRANRKLQCYPGIRTIAKDLKMSEPTVKRALRDLVLAGFVKKETRWRENGGQSSNLYILSTVEKPVENAVEDVDNSPEDNISCSDQTEDICQNEIADTISEKQLPEAGENISKYEETCQSEPLNLSESHISVDGNKPVSNEVSPIQNDKAITGHSSTLFQSVRRIFSKAKTKFSALLGYMTPAPGHEFTPKVNLSVYHYLKDKLQAEKKTRIS